MRVALKSTVVASLLGFVLAVLLANAVSDLLNHKEGERDGSIEEMFSSRTSRKLQQYGDDEDMNRIGMACSKEDIAIYEGQVPPLPSGIPAYRVQIMNMCASDCNIAKIRLHCGWFSSARLINPRVFRRVGYDDCLVNDGDVLGPGKTISFEYANTYRYPLSVSSVLCS